MVLLNNRGKKNANALNNNIGVVESSSGVCNSSRYIANCQRKGAEAVIILQEDNDNYIGGAAGQSIPAVSIDPIDSATLLAYLANNPHAIVTITLAQ